MNIYLRSICLLLVFLPVSCVDEAKDVVRRMREQPEKKLESFVVDLGTPLEDRVMETPAVLLEYLKKIDETDTYRAYIPDEAEMKILKEYLGYLPQKIREVLEAKLLGIFFVDTLQGGGMSDFVFDKEGVLYSVLVLNPRILKTSLGEWLRFRDASAFTTDQGVVIASDCGDSYVGLLHTLFHEASHIYDYHRQMTPWVEPGLAALSSVTATAFTESAWATYAEPLKTHDFPERKNISFYDFGPRLDGARAASMYVSLGATPFSSLYGSTSWAEDFAESFTWFYLEKRLGIRYETSVVREGIVLARYSPSDNENVRKRHKILEMILTSSERSSS